MEKEQKIRELYDKINRLAWRHSQPISNPTKIESEIKELYQQVYKLTTRTAKEN